MSRDDLLNTNYNIMKSVVTEAIKYSPGCILIIVSNPLDAMAQTAYKLSGFPRNRVIVWRACWIRSASGLSLRMS